jgi:competence protein ComEC
MTTFIFALAFVLGCWWLQQQPVLPPLAGAFAIVPLAVLALALRRWGLGVAAGACGAVALAAAGFHWAAAIGYWKLGSVLDEQWEGRDVVIEGVIAEMPQSHARGARMRFDVERALTPGAGVPSRIALNWYEDDTQPGFIAGSLRPGQRWRLTARLRRPHGNYNPHGFDLERWLLERGMRASGYVRGTEPQMLLDESVSRPRYLVERIRESVRTRLLAALEGRPYGGVVVALAVGDQQAIPREQWTLFTRTGVNHLMSISGLHITMVASLAFALVAAAWRRSGSLSGRVPAISVATAAGLVAAIGYAALAGFAVPAQRTVFMLAVVAVALWSGWRWPVATVLGFALGLVALLDPMSVSAPGFWLSFGAVAAIALASAGRIGHAGWIAAWARSQWAVTVALVPLLLALFQQVSVVSPLANAVAIPLVSLVVAPLALLAIAIPVDAVAQLAHAMMALCIGFLQWLALAPGAAWQQHAPQAWAVAAALFGAGWLLLPRGFPGRWVGASAMLPLFLVHPAVPADGEAWVTVLDVGQGLAVVARTRNHTLLFDAGPGYAGGGDAGERIVVPFLRGEGVRSLDVLMVSHDDLDHTGGALSVLAAMPVARTLSSLPESHPLNASSPVARRCVAGEHWEWDRVEFEVLHPESDSYNGPLLKDNDRSCVLRIATGNGAVLIAADIESASERALLARARAKLGADIVVAPHHGSRTSSGRPFVESIAPRLVVFPVGYRNRFGHPHPVVAARYRATGARLLRTDVSGAISFRLGSGEIRTGQWRLTQPRYWHDSN